MFRPMILIVEEGPETRSQTQLLLEGFGYLVEKARSEGEALERVRSTPVPDLVLLDMPRAALETLQRLRQCRPFLKVILLCPESDPRLVVQAVRSGAANCLAKPCEKDALQAVLRECLGSIADAPVPANISAEAYELGETLSFVASGPAMRKLRAQLEQVARIDIPVLFLGESGTGKEVMARMLHHLSSRAQRTFLKVNCAAVPADLLESELFGYERGAFTGAIRSKPGKFELCHKGTILLDEIGEMPPELQAKLLHVLQDQEFTRLGGCAKVVVDVRVLAATNVDIKQAIADKRFREDLYYRLNTFVFRLPPLRERREDIALLLQYYLTRYAARYGLPARPLSPALLDRCLCCPWPGNIRELESFAKRYLIVGDEALAMSDPVQRDEPVAAGRSAEGPETGLGDMKSRVRSLRDGAESLAIASALERTNWNRREAARLLNISYKSLLNKIRQYAIGRLAEANSDSRHSARTERRVARPAHAHHLGIAGSSGL